VQTKRFGWLTSLAMLILAGGAARAEDPAPQVPAQLAVSATEHLLLRARATGVQIYVCSRAPDGKPQWTLKAPQAQLRDEQGALIGQHGAGPSWRHADGSEVTAKMAARIDSPDSNSIPWLLLSATAHSGSGRFAAVTSVQRIHTQGGQPPPAASCNLARQQGKEARIPYHADYYFYVPAGK